MATDDTSAEDFGYDPAWDDEGASQTPETIRRHGLNGGPEDLACFSAIIDMPVDVLFELLDAETAAAQTTRPRVWERRQGLLVEVPDLDECRTWRERHAAKKTAQHATVLRYLRRQHIDDTMWWIHEHHGKHDPDQYLLALAHPHLPSPLAAANIAATVEEFFGSEARFDATVHAGRLNALTLAAMAGRAARFGASYLHHATRH